MPRDDFHRSCRFLKDAEFTQRRLKLHSSPSARFRRSNMLVWRLPPSPSVADMRGGRGAGGGARGGAGGGGGFSGSAGLSSSAGSCCSCRRPSSCQSGRLPRRSRRRQRVFKTSVTNGSTTQLKQTKFNYRNQSFFNVSHIVCKSRESEISLQSFPFSYIWNLK